MVMLIIQIMFHLLCEFVCWQFTQKLMDRFALKCYQWRLSAQSHYILEAT